MNLFEITKRIGNHWLDLRLTLKKVAARRGLTRNWLTKVESFCITPLLLAPRQIASALGVIVDELVDGPDEQPKLIKVKQAERKVVERKRSSTNTTVDESLAHKRSNLAMDVFLRTVSAGVACHGALSHKVEDFLRVQRVPCNLISMLKSIHFTMAKVCMLVGMLRIESLNHTSET